MFCSITRLLFAVDLISMSIANASVVPDQKANQRNYFIGHAFHVGPICNSCYPQVPFLITAHETKQWPFFHTASFTCAFGKKRSTCINIFWRTIKQNNKGLLQRFMFNRMPRLQPFQRQFFEMKLVSKVGNIAFNPWEFIILANRTAKFSSCRT